MKQQVSSPWHRVLPSLVIVVLFALIALIYFSPAIWQGRELYQQDVAGASGTAQDVRNLYEATGETSYWTNSLFGGMPMYQISPSYPSLSILKHAQDLYTLQWPLNLLPSYSWLLFAMLVGFFIFMQALRVGRWTALLGSIMWAFSSYFIILIDAGHIWKLTVLAFIPPTIAGIVWIYRGRYLLGGVTTAFFAALQLMSNHVQMSYYFGLLIVMMLAAYLVEAVRAGQMKRFLIATATLIIAALIAIGANSSNLYHTYQYTQQTMRGGSPLAESGSSTPSSGLDKAYITQWSYGKAETLTLLVPNSYGGATGYLGQNEQLLQDVPLHLRQYVGQMNQYWGDQPFTSGPVYVGAFVLFLFVLGLFIVRTPLKWALLGGTLLSVALSWGHNMMWLTDLFIDYFPLYNKFRTVSSILVVAEFTIPTLAILALVRLLDDPRGILQRERRAIVISTIVTAGIALLMAIAPGLFFDFLSDQEAEMFRSAMGNPVASEILTQLTSVRASIVSTDAWRSLLVIALGLGVCYLYSIDKLSRLVAVGLLTVITLVDLWQVDKRYLYDDKFIDSSRVASQARPVTEVDRAIAADPDPHYRVLNQSVNTFNDATTSFMHRSVGGYHAAKLSRYQDLIEYQIARGNKRVLDMLDVRYVISSDESGRQIYSRNPEALGAAWFVDSLLLVGTPREEMAALDHLDPSHTAVMERSSAPASAARLSGEAGQTAVQLLSYQPGKASYEVETDRDRLLILSEIYYPHGWQLNIDGKPREILRANYLLRAVEVPKGKHRLDMFFDPKSLHTTEGVSLAAQGVLILGLILGIARRVRCRREQSQVQA